MTKNIFKTLLVAIATLALISSCKKESDKYACTKPEFLGTYKGAHSLVIKDFSINIAVPDTIIINDISGDSVTIESKLLNRVIRAKVGDCQIQTPNQSVESFSVTLSAGTAVVNNVTAYLVVKQNTTKNQLETTLKVISGSAALPPVIPAPGLAINDTELSGTFKK
jgi:hypothetical protein